GPWLNAAKSAMRRGAGDDEEVAVPGGARSAGLLRREAFRIGPGQRIAYVTDAAGHAANLQAIAALAAGASQPLLAAPFLDADRHLAAATAHLTARQAGEVARRAGAARVVPFHFSARYLGDAAPLQAEVAAAFAAG